VAIIRRKILNTTDKWKDREVVTRDGKVQMIVVRSDRAPATADPFVNNRPWKSSTKINSLVAQLAKIMDETKEKVIIFSQFTTMLTLVEDPLSIAGYEYVRYDGQMSLLAKEEALGIFRGEPECRILLMSLKCGGLGLNLTVASRVMMLDPWWNPALEDQAVDRAHRLGQTNAVRVLRFTIANSVEDRILALQNQKRALADSALGEGGLTQMARLTLNDLVFLFKGGVRDDDE